MARRKERLNIEPLLRFSEVLPSGDLTLIVLKGHLLIEEQLVSLIARNVKDPTALRGFHFFHRLCLTKAMYYNNENAWVWTSIEKLNKARNHLAHEAEARALKVKANDFIVSVDRSAHVGKTETIEEGMRGALIFVCGVLERLQKKKRY
jgi:hypothetical protein